MNDKEQQENSENDYYSQYYIMLVAYKTMKERCQQLQARLATVEEENVCLRLECGKDMSTAITKVKDNEQTAYETLQERIEELVKEKSQLTHHVYMVAEENRQLWKRLTKLKRTNKTLGNQLTKISDTLKQHPSAQVTDISTNNGEKDESLEDISLKLLNNIMLGKSQLEQQYDEMVQWHNNVEFNLQNLGFTYSVDSDTDSFEQLKQHDVRLTQTKDALLAQQARLKKALMNLKKIKKGLTCNNCRTNAMKKMCQAGTQFDSDDSFREHGATQTSLQTPSLSPEKSSNVAENVEQDNRICPLCGSFYGKDTSFKEFHEHVLSHFGKDVFTEGFENIH